MRWMIVLKLIRNFFIILFLLLSILSTYVVTAYIFSTFPTKNLDSVKKEQTVYLLYNEMHSDIVFDLEDVSDLWIKNLPIVKNKKGYIAFGWGDKETYLNTPTWDDFKVSTSLKALFINTPSLMHITYYSSLKPFTNNVKSITLNSKQKKSLTESIFKGFEFQQHSYKGYGNNDYFYDSSYKYNLINTCNTWTGKTLRDANISMSYWTPFSHNVVNALP